MKVAQQIFLSLLFILNLNTSTLIAAEPPFLKFKNDDWVNEQLTKLTTEEKIAQLMILTAYPKQSDTEKDIIVKLIKTHKPGGVLIMQGTPSKTASWINQFQETSEIPLLIALDGEWGPRMRIDSTMSYPYAQAIGAIQDSTYIYQMGRDFGNQLKLMGINMNFAPVADVNTNPSNPVINFRSFGEDKNNVAEKAWMIAKGMQDVGVIPVAKHFPGHGDTKTDSHKTLPLIAHSKSRMDKIESYPFRYLTEKGISGIMSAHLNVPALDNSGTPSSLSKKIITDYLKKEIGFSGFVVTDAINMRGVITETGNAEVEALKAGNDLIEFVPDLKKAIESVQTAIGKDEITIQEIDEKCRTVLALKRWCGLNEYKAASLTNLTAQLNSPYFELTSRKLIKESLTVLKNGNILPVQNLDQVKIASVSLGGDKISPFQKMLDKYTEVDHFILPKTATEREWLKLRKELDNYNLVIGGIEGISLYPSKAYGTSEIQRRAVSELVQDNNAVFAFFGNAYAIKHFKNIHHSKALVLAYQNNQLTQELAAQFIFGAFNSSGKLPVTIDNRFKINDGYVVKKNENFSFTIPEEVEINSTLLKQKVDSIALLGIEKGAYPGCQVLIAKNGKVIFHECYGYHTYERENKVKHDNIYDWASITKVTGPLPAIMKLVDEKKINLDSCFSTYWPDFKISDKKDLVFRDVLAHQAKLPAWIPFWTMALNDKQELDRRFFKNNPTWKFNVRVSENLYMNEDFLKTMFDTIRTTKLTTRNRYLYSGLSFYCYPQIISTLTNQPYEQYLQKEFYRPMGASTVTYNAYKHYPLNRIIPSEKDDFFRKEEIIGFVHDEGAAMMGGISGNAGLFGTCNDLAKIFQMYLQKGYFGGKRYISEATVEEFTRQQFPENKNRRGLGFDKPLIDNYKNKLEDAYPAVSAGKSSFGHSGFTGTFAWADPENQLLFIFMSNRVYPTRENPVLYQYNIRTAMHQAIYDSIKTGLK